MAVFFTRRGTPPSLGTRLGDLEIGTIVHIKENGVYQDYLVVNQGLPSSMYDSSCDGTWLLRKDIYSKQVWRKSTDDNIYESSAINNYLNETFSILFDTDIKNIIKQVKIPYVNGTGSSGFVASGPEGLSVKIFLLSGYEVGYSTSDTSSIPIDGAKLSYFEIGTGTTALNKRIANYNGSASWWWLRSPVTYNNASAYVVGSNGRVVNQNAFSSYGVRPAFIFPFDYIVDDNNNIL